MDVCGQIRVRPLLSSSDRGAGKLRHINISLLWVQGQEKLKKLVYEKVPGQDNPADLFTKGVGREKLQQFAWASGQVFLDGRAEAGLQVQGVGLSMWVYQQLVLEVCQEVVFAYLVGRVTP